MTSGLVFYGLPMLRNWDSMPEFTDCPCAFMAPCNKLGPAAEFLRDVKGVTLVAWVAYFPAALVVDPDTV